ncbi:unnamed protein product [Heligmosomoides polygyrus]|uniref:YhcG_C domain-containing protein n=1 Tax=Heligmosomoides polygyrus TaxID=6339 RepID=A0A183G7Z3_HELPZ|nr:unnamed protein product [Heligmosomoides polygyrus]
MKHPEPMLTDFLAYLVSFRRPLLRQGYSLEASPLKMRPVTGAPSEILDRDTFLTEFSTEAYLKERQQVFVTDLIKVPT